MLKKCATSVLHFNKKNLILGHIPHLYLRKNIFYCRIETHKIKGIRKFIRFSLHTTNYFEAREMVKNMTDMDAIFNELKELYGCLSHRYEFIPDDDTSKLKSIVVLDDNSDKELLKKIHSVFEKCYDVPLDNLIKNAEEYVVVLDDLLKLRPDSRSYIEEIKNTKREKEKWKSYISNLKEYKETYQKVEVLIPQIQKLLSSTSQKQSSVQVVNQNIQPIYAALTNQTNTDKPLVTLPNIGILINDMVAKKNNSEKESRREVTLLQNKIKEVGISLEDDYSKLYNADIITLLGKNIQQLDIKGSVKCQHKRYIVDLIRYASTRSKHYYTEDFIELLPNLKKTKKNETNPHKPYKPEELVKIFDPQYDFFKENSDVFWSCLVGLYTGSRTRAATTLQFKDIIQVEGIMCIDINLNHKIKRVKNDETVRKVPVHSDLIDLGFLDYVARHKKERNAKDEDFIFPECQTKTGNYNGHFMERTFFEFLKELGIKKDVGKDKKQADSKNKNGKKTQRKKPETDGHDFHSFRKNINLALEKAEVSSTYIDQIIGWEGKTVREIFYSEHELIDIKEQLEKLHYDFLEPAFAEWKKIMATK